MPFGKANKEGICTGWSEKVPGCGKPIHIGDNTTWNPTFSGKVVHSECYFSTEPYKLSQEKKAALEAAQRGEGNGLPTEAVKAPAVQTESKPASGNGNAKSETKPANGEAKPEAKPASENGNNSDLLSMIAGAVLPLVQKEVKANVNMDEIKATIETAVLLAVEANSKTIVINDKAANTVKELDGLQHRQFPELLALLDAGLYPFMYDAKDAGNIGGPGAGKSTAAQQAAEALNLKFGHISLNMQTPPSALLGYMDAHGKYVRTPFRDAYEHGGVFLFDELDNANGNLLTSMNTALANGSMAFPDGIIPRHETFLAIAAGNTAGRGANAMHNSRQVLDEASRERFAFLGWGYDEDLERKAALAHYDKADKWITWVQKARQSAATLGLRILATPRASINGAKLLKRKAMKVNQIADCLVFKGVDADTKTKVLANVPLPNVA
jgi:cobaltochelatase CobS